MESAVARSESGSHNQDARQAGLPEDGDQGVEARPDPSLANVLFGLLRHPIRYFVKRWHWKVALTSALVRGLLYFATNITAGFEAALGAMGFEMVYRLFATGSGGVVVQAVRNAHPRWASTALASIGVPLTINLTEFYLHWMRGTPELIRSIIASILVACLACSFNLFAMRRGVFIVGSKRQSYLQDLKSIPILAAQFATAAYRTVFQRR